MRRSALSMRLVTVVLVLLPGSGRGGAGQRRRVGDAAAAGGDLHGQGQVPPAPLASQGRAAGLLPVVTVRAALLVCSVPTLLVALTRVSRPGVGQGDVGGCARPGVVEGDDVAEGLAHGAGADAGGLGDAQVGAVDAAGHRGAGVVAGVGSGVVLVSAAALVMLPLPVETCTVRVGAAGPLARLPGSRSGPRCWFAVCPRCWWR